MRYIRKYHKNPAVTRVHEHDDVVQSGLAYTPSDMLNMASHGLPVSVGMLSETSVDMGSTTATFDIPLEHRKHTDVAMLWQQSQTIKRKMKKSIQENKIISE